MTPKQRTRLKDWGDACDANWLSDDFATLEPLIDILLAWAVAAEREANAKLVEDHGHSNGRIRSSHKHLAAAIRARKDPL